MGLRSYAGNEFLAYVELILGASHSRVEGYGGSFMENYGPSISARGSNIE